MYGIGHHPPGYSALRYLIIVQSPAPEADIRQELDEADAHSPVLDIFRRPFAVERSIQILSTMPSEK